MVSTQTHISVRDLNVWYGQQQVLKNITLDIPDKKVTAIIGPSGCGKTTLLKSFNRLIDLQDTVKVTGQVLVDGENVYDDRTDLLALRKKMGLLSQRPQVLPLSIYDNVAYGPRLHGLKDKSKLDILVEKYLREANIWNEVQYRLKSSASKLSIGQQQRLCLARGLAVEPEIILGDEPTSALDPISAEVIEKRLVQLKNDYTVVVVTHSLRQARNIADYVVFLYLGELVEHGPADEFFTQQKDTRTTAYLKGAYIPPKDDETLAW
jgi:ABC-type phosphate transport system, ATPase component